MSTWRRSATSSSRTRFIVTIHDPATSSSSKPSRRPPVAPVRSGADDHARGDRASAARCHSGVRERWRENLPTSSDHFASGPPRPMVVVRSCGVEPTCHRMSGRLHRLQFSSQLRWCPHLWQSLAKAASGSDALSPLPSMQPWSPTETGGSGATRRQDGRDERGSRPGCRERVVVSEFSRTRLTSRATATI